MLTSKPTKPSVVFLGKMDSWNSFLTETVECRLCCVSVAMNGVMDCGMVKYLRIFDLLLKMAMDLSNIYGSVDVVEGWICSSNSCSVFG